MSWGVMGGQLGWSGLIDEGWRKGPWTAEEDRLLIEYVRSHGEGRWNSVARLAGLKRNGKSCRLRWVNYLRPDLKRGQITPHEENIILELHARWGNRWSTIARSLPGRTDNEIKNYWRTHFKKKAKPVPENSDKARTRILKRQQFQQQQQQKHEQQQQQQQLLLQQQQQQQQQLLQLNQLDMKKIMSLLDENNNYENKVTSSYVHPHQIRQHQQPEIPNNFYHPNTTSSMTDHHQFGLLNSVFNNNNNNNNCSGSNEASNEENILWDGLWNLDDVHGYFGACGSTKPTMHHNLVAPFC